MKKTLRWLWLIGALIIPSSQVLAMFNTSKLLINQNKKLHSQLIHFVRKLQNNKNGLRNLKELQQQAMLIPYSRSKKDILLHQLKEMQQNFPIQYKAFDNSRFLQKYHFLEKKFFSSGSNQQHLQASFGGVIAFLTFIGIFDRDFASVICLVLFLLWCVEAIHFSADKEKKNSFNTEEDKKKEA